VPLLVMLGFVLGVVSRDVVTRFVAMEQEVAKNARERGELALRRSVIPRDVLYARATTIRWASGTHGGSSTRRLRWRGAGDHCGPSGPPRPTLLRRASRSSGLVLRSHSSCSSDYADPSRVPIGRPEPYWGGKKVFLKGRSWAASRFRGALGGPRTLRRLDGSRKANALARRSILYSPPAPLSPFLHH
jgi:hypothetical protein